MLLCEYCTVSTTSGVIVNLNYCSKQKLVSHGLISPGECKAQENVQVNATLGAEKKSVYSLISKAVY